MGVPQPSAWGKGGKAKPSPPTAHVRSPSDRGPSAGFASVDLPAVR